VRKFLIINADDLGASSGINRGIIECHTRGVLTSTSLMVTGRAASEAVAMSRDHPALGVGLHWDVWGEGEREFDLADHEAVRDEFQRQLDKFHRLTGRMPTHVDSHRHAHLDKAVMPVFRELVEPLGLPLRGCGPVGFVGGFYAQWEWRVTNLEYVSVTFLQKLLGEEVPEGWTELSCHPGHVTPEFRSVYLHEREEEVRTLTDPRVRQTVEDLGIRLANHADYRASVRAPV
jgi:chitin disaccharide deacetylase